MYHNESASNIAGIQILLWARVHIQTEIWLNERKGFADHGVLFLLNLRRSQAETSKCLSQSPALADSSSCAMRSLATFAGPADCESSSRCNDCITAEAPNTVCSQPALTTPVANRTCDRLLCGGSVHSLCSICVQHPTLRARRRNLR